jgi:uncharacterized RDD family membrane protein YckC
MNRKYIRRILAYFIDITILSIIALSLSKIPFLNPYYDAYNAKYEEYIELNKNYQDKNIDYDKYLEEYKIINYELGKYSIYSDTIYIAVYILYFVIFNYITQGQTLGKKLLKLRVVDNKSNNSNPNIFKYLIRTLILYELILKIPLIILVNITNVNNYNIISNIIYYLQNILELVIIITFIIRPDGRAIHDLVAGTIVVDNDEIDNSSNDIEEKIIEAEYTEIKK